MADPMTYAEFIGALKAEGLTVIEHKTGGESPSQHNRNHKGAWGPVHGVMIHHTVTKGHDHTIETCRKGYSGLPGPLCHGVICKAGHVHVVGYGRANHAGSGDDDVLRAVIDEKPLPADNEANTDGNRHFYGFECENLGDGKDPWPAAQLEAIERAAAAICRHHGWNERSVIGHLEWQPGKVDPRGFTMTSMRARVDARLKQRPGANSAPAHQEDDDMPTAHEIAAEIFDRYKMEDPRREGTQYVTPKEVLWWAGANAAQANTRAQELASQVKTLTTQVRELTTLVQRLAAANAKE